MLSRTLAGKPGCVPTLVGVIAAVFCMTVGESGEAAKRVEKTKGSGPARIHLRTDLDRTALAGGTYSVDPHRKAWVGAIESGVRVQPFTAKTAAEIIVHLAKDFKVRGRALETAFGAENGAVLYLPASQYERSSVDKQVATIRGKGYEHAHVELVEKNGNAYYALRIGRTIDLIQPVYEQAKRAIPELLAFSDLTPQGFRDLTNLPLHLAAAAIDREHDLGFYLPGKAKTSAKQRERLLEIAAEHGLTFAGGGWAFHFLEGDKGLAAQTLDNLDREAAHGRPIFTVHAGDNDNDRHSLSLPTVDLAVVVKAKGGHHKGLVDSLSHLKPIARLQGEHGLASMRGKYLTEAEAPDALPTEVLEPLVQAARQGAE